MPKMLLLVLFLIPMCIAGQDMRCPAVHGISPHQSPSDYARFQALLSFKLKENHNIRPRTINYFPVVIHVVAREGDIPVTEAQVLNQLDVMNADFAGRGQNIPKLLPEFLSIAGQADMQFCLAKTDPEGNPTSGITYTETDIDNIALQTGPEGRIAIHYDQLGGKTGWDPSRYINIWIGAYGDILGSASFPGSAPFPEETGIVIDPKYFGSIGEAGNSGNFGRGHTLTHEMGHYFGLKHIWGEGLEINCEDSDDIPDTPNAAGPYYGCPEGEQITCETSDMYQNFMDFSDDRCLAAFTNDQVAFMQTAQEVYYPDLPVDGSCAPTTDTFESWFHNLSWSHDAASDTYIIYSDEVFNATRDISVFSADGRLAYQGEWSFGQSYLVNLKNLAAGVYFLRIDQDEQYFVRSIVIY